MFDRALRAMTSRLRLETDRAGVAIICGERRWSGSLSPLRPRQGDRNQYLLYSFTKTIVACATLRMAARGELDLDVPVSAWVESPACATRITLRQLLGHTSGLRDYGGLKAYHAAVHASAPPWSRARYLAEVRAEELLFEPGQGWAYSNIGYMLVKEVLERVARADLSFVLDREVFQPLGIEDARVPHERADLETHVFGPSRLIAGGDVRAGYHPGWIAPGVVGASPLSAACILHGVMSGELLAPPLQRQMMEARPVGGSVDGRPWQIPGYGLGLMIELANTSLAPIGHTGGGPGCSPAICHFRRARPPLTIAVVTNCEDAGQAEAMVMDAAAALT